MLLLVKASNVINPGSRGGHPWIDDKGRARYDKRPTGRPAHYLAEVTLSDGSKRFIEPRPAELDANGQVIGGRAAVREIVNRELFGEYGFKTDGTFWQNKGILMEYRATTNAKGKVVVEDVPRHAGYSAIDFRDPSVARAYDKGLPAKITKFAVDAKEPTPLPSKEKVELPEGGTADKPGIHEIGIHTVPPHHPDTLVAIGEPLKDKEDPLALATAYLDAYLNARKPSQAKTEAGQERARAERKGQFDGVVGSREIKPLPDWAVNKYSTPEELQIALSRGEDGKPLTTLITLGLWNKENKSKRVREQLVSEWTPFIRRWARRFASVFANTDSYRKFDKIDGGGEKAQRNWLYDRERDLFNDAVIVLLDEANAYKSNDETVGPYSRFDKKAENAIKNHLEKKSKEAAIEQHGATALDDMAENMAYASPKMISPREHFELRHYEPMAHKIIAEALKGLDKDARKVFMSRLWLDDSEDPDQSDERVHAEARERQRMKRGESKAHWGRPMTGDGSVAAKLADLNITTGFGKTKRLGDMEQSLQHYHLKNMYDEAVRHLESKFRTPSGGLTPNGALVEKWLRLEAKVAQMNRREISERTKVPTTTDVKMPVVDERRMQPLATQEHPAVSFFRTNRELANKLGVANDLDVPQTLANVKAPLQIKPKTDKLSAYHQLHQNVLSMNDHQALRSAVIQHVDESKAAGHWVNSDNSIPQWHENRGVVALHNAAVRLHQSRGEDAQALTEYAQATETLGKRHPMVAEYTQGLRTLGAAPTNSDLARWKSSSHTTYRDNVNRLHVIDAAIASKTSKSTISDFRKSLNRCVSMYDALIEVL